LLLLPFPAFVPGCCRLLHSLCLFLRTLSIDPICLGPVPGSGCFGCVARFGISRARWVDGGGGGSYAIGDRTIR
jgi:hypothetical protein